MFARRAGLAVAAMCLFATYVMADRTPQTQYGAPVSDAVAAEAQGGICQWLSLVWCPGDGVWWHWWCPSGWRVASGAVYGEAYGTIYCTTDCQGSYFSNYGACPGTGIAGAGS